jgi:hypothetical protein
MVAVLTVSILVAIVGVAAIWLFTARYGSGGDWLRAHAAGKPDALSTSGWRLTHLGPNAVQKCNAYRMVLTQTESLQAAGGGGAMSPADQTHQAAALTAANAMAPTSVTALQCGVPL